MRAISGIAFMIAALFCRSQEALCPLGANLSYFYENERQFTKPAGSAEKKLSHKLQLPFRDDFSYCNESPFPDPKRWEDSRVYINCGYAYAPPTLGVATFDGLNEFGYPYNPNLLNMNLSDTADKLTSLPIDLHVIAATSKTLQPADSVALVFFYQRRGYGDPPEQNDSLFVDLYRPLENKWDVEVWSRAGNSSQMIDTAFYKAFIRISDTAYFHDGFRFRIRNRATTAGNFDHFHVDYVMLDYNLLPVNTTYFDDITFGTVPAPLLRNYAAMPWQHFSNDEVAERISVRIRNNNPPSTPVQNTSYEYRITNAKTGALLYRYPGGPSVLSSFDSSGYSLNSAHRTPAVKDSVNFPTLTDSTDFDVKHYVFRSGQLDDFNRANDTVIQRQRFRNYFALDDGSAEAGYYVNGKNIRMAVRIKLNRPDTLRSVRIYFDPSGPVKASESYEFRINVWASTGGAPGDLILYDSIVKPRFTKTFFKGVPEYSLTTPVVFPAGEYFVGIQQRGDKSIVIGFDRNFDFKQHVYFDPGSGWEQSILPGSLMIRPVFGQYVPPPQGITGHGPLLPFRVFPNPATTGFTIEHPMIGRSRYALYNITGILVAEGDISSDGNAVRTAGFVPGIYILVLNREGLPPQQQRIVIEP
jgi:hypothetical protein